jgi:hypothetical protein
MVKKEIEEKSVGRGDSGNEEEYFRTISYEGQK